MSTINLWCHRAKKMKKKVIEHYKYNKNLIDGIFTQLGFADKSINNKHGEHISFVSHCDFYASMEK